MNGTPSDAGDLATRGDAPRPAALPTAAEVEAARALLRPHLATTRLVEAPGLSRALGGPVHLKLESELPTGSFKPRGALYALTRRLEEGEVAGVVASSTGNHGAAVAWAAAQCGVPATIYLPRGPNPVKRRRIEELGARIIEVGTDLAEAAEAAAEDARARGAYYLDDATDRRVPAGAGTIGLELLEQAPGGGTLVVPMGDTALVRGIGAATREARPGFRIVGVQAATAPSYRLSWERGEPVPTESCETIADGLATRTPHAPNVEAIRAVVDDIVLVTDDELVGAVRRLLLEEHVVAEPSGAAATAAALQLRGLEGPAILLVTGANLDPALLPRVAAPA